MICRKRTWQKLGSEEERWYILLEEQINLGLREMRYLRERSDLTKEKRVAVKYAFEENKTASDGGRLSHPTAKVRSRRFGKEN
jgi:hypothetical protein